TQDECDNAKAIIEGQLHAQVELPARPRLRGALGGVCRRPAAQAPVSRTDLTDLKHRALT
ncbi:MAG: hypothetical protein ABIR68_09200, partial [Ilumatobacteraceae bacterium]